MNRRDFHRHLGALGALGATTPGARSQGAPAEGKGYLQLGKPIPMAPDKVEVVAFFGYLCPYCDAFEPMLDAWAKKLPAEVNFRRVPVLFQYWPQQHSKLYYALEALGLLDKLHRSAFAALRIDKQRLDKDSDIGKWAADNGADGAKILQVMNSPPITTRMHYGERLAGWYSIKEVPALGLHGRYITSPAIAGSQERALQVTDQLVAQIRATMKKG